MYSDVIDWLLASDPAIRWQSKRDLLHLPESEYLKDRSSITTQGWGKQLLDLQETNGMWGGGLYGPKFISTHYTLLLLRRFGMLPNHCTTRACDQLIHLKAIGGTLYTEKPGTCITGMALGIFGHFQSQDSHYDGILDYLEEHQLSDGGWNCRHPRVQTKHSSVHTTLSVLEGLRELAQNYPTYQQHVNSLREPAHEFLLVHELFKSHTTGQLIHPDMIELTFPPRWKYNILSALDYFASIAVPYDKRMADAVAIVKKDERKKYWYKGKQLSGKKYFSLNTPRKPSEWNTLRAYRVLSAYGEQ